MWPSTVLVQGAAGRRSESSDSGQAVTLSGMPFKHNVTRCHRIPKARYRVRNWPAYEAGLKRRGDLTLCIDETALAGWHAPRRTTPGGQAWYSDTAIALVLMLRLVFHLALRQAEGFATSVLRLLGQELCVPDHTTLSRHSQSFAGRQPTTAKVRLDAGKAERFSVSAQSTAGFNRLLPAVFRCQDGAKRRSGPTTTRYPKNVC